MTRKIGIKTTSVQSNMSIQQITGLFMNHCLSKNLSKNTIEYYKYRLGAFNKFIDENYQGITISEVSSKLIREFIIQETKNTSASTANHSIIALRSFFNYLASDDLIMNNTMKPNFADCHTIINNEWKML